MVPGGPLDKKAQERVEGLSVIATTAQAVMLAAFSDFYCNFVSSCPCSDITANLICRYLQAALW
jgi:hypothetical protein